GAGVRERALHLAQELGVRAALGPERAAHGQPGGLRRAEALDAQRAGRAVHDARQCAPARATRNLTRSSGLATESITTRQVPLTMRHGVPGTCMSWICASAARIFMSMEKECAAARNASGFTLLQRA